MGRKPKAAWRCALCSTTASEATPRSQRKRALCEDCYESLAPRGLAWCSQGGHRVKTSAMADRYICRACKAEQQHGYYLQTKELQNARSLAYYHAHRDACRATHAAWYAANAETERAKQRARTAADPEAARERAARWRRAHLDTARACTRSWRRRHPEAARTMDRRRYQRKKLKAWRDVR